jgi:hypothetical protein
MDIKVALIGAVATIIAAAIAGVVAINTGAVQVSVSDPQADIDDLRTTATSLQQENEELAAANTDLEEQLAEAEEAPARTTTTTTAGDEGSTTPTTSADGPRTSTVRRETGGTPLAFSYGYSVDLDSQEADWTVQDGQPSGWDLYWSPYTGLSTYEVVIFDHVPTEAECDDATVRQEGLREVQSVEGTMMCVLTSEDRYAFVRIADVDDEARTASLDVTVWE